MSNQKLFMQYIIDEVFLKLKNSWKRYETVA